MNSRLKGPFLYHGGNPKLTPARRLENRFCAPILSHNLYNFLSREPGPDRGKANSGKSCRTRGGAWGPSSFVIPILSRYIITSVSYKPFRRLRVRAKISSHFGASAGPADAMRSDAGDVVTSSRSCSAADACPPPRPVGLRLPGPTTCLWRIDTITDSAANRPAKVRRV